MTDYKNLRVDREIKEDDSQTDACGCDCSTDGCCDDTNKSEEKEAGPISLTLDGKSIDVHPEDNNIVDVAARAKIAIPAPCYLAKRKYGCCNACVIEVDGKQKFACSTSPKNGMNITVNREDLKALRKERLLKYKEGIRTGNLVPCSSSGK